MGETGAKDTSVGPPAHVPAPGTERPRRYRPKLRYELLGCGLHGHELLGTDAAQLRAEDALFARESDGLRWYRCMRCDSWVALTRPDQATRKYPPSRDEVTLPLRGKPLHDRYILRLIALERVVHFVVLAALAAVVLLFAHNRATLNQDFTRILKDLQGGLGGPVVSSNHGIVHDLRSLFAVSITSLYLVGAAIAAYAVMEGVEAIGLWLGQRWAEYLTLVATIAFVPYEVYELTKSVSWLKALTLLLNLAVAAYLLFAKRLFGLRGGGRAEQAEYDADVGWPAIERSTPRGLRIAGAMTYGLVPAEELPRADIERVRDIYEAGFPARLRAGFGSLLDGRQPGELPLALTEEGEPVGFAMLRPLGTTGWIYLRYFVVDAARRGRGLGGILWTELTERLRESGYSLLVFDVEDPDEPGRDQQEAQIRSRRIAFYGRHGASVLPVTGYRTPEGDDGQGPWTPMLLMAAGLTAGDPPTAAAGGLRAVVEAVYLHRWSLTPDHPQVSNTQLAGPG